MESFDAYVCVGLLGGHGRVEAAKTLGIRSVPTLALSHLSETERRAYVLADNKLALNAGWDKEMLAIELQALVDLELDTELTGFSLAEVDFVLDEAGEADPSGPDTPEDAVPLLTGDPVTRRGDLWILGDHRLLCGDSSSPQDLDRLLGGQPIHLVNMDPPYNVKVEPRSNNAIAAGLSSFQGTTHHQSMDVARHPEKAKPTQKKMRAKDRPLANDFVTDQEFDRLLDAWFGNASRVLLPGRGFYIWGGYANCAN